MQVYFDRKTGFGQANRAIAGNQRLEGLHSMGKVGEKLMLPFSMKHWMEQVVFRSFLGNHCCCQMARNDPTNVLSSSKVGSWEVGKAMVFGHNDSQVGNLRQFWECAVHRQLRENSFQRRPQKWSVTMQSWQLTIEPKDLWKWESCHVVRTRGLSPNRKWLKQMISKVLPGFKIHHMFNMIKIVFPVDSSIARKHEKLWSWATFSKVTWASCTLACD